MLRLLAKRCLSYIARPVAQTGNSDLLKCAPALASSAFLHNFTYNTQCIQPHCILPSADRASFHTSSYLSSPGQQASAGPSSAQSDANAGSNLVASCSSRTPFLPAFQQQNRSFAYITKRKGAPQTRAAKKLKDRGLVHRSADEPVSAAPADDPGDAVATTEASEERPSDVQARTLSRCPALSGCRRSSFRLV